MELKKGSQFTDPLFKIYPAGYSITERLYLRKKRRNVECYIIHNLKISLADLSRKVKFNKRDLFARITTYLAMNLSSTKSFLHGWQQNNIFNIETHWGSSRG